MRGEDALLSLARIAEQAPTAAEYERQTLAHLRQRIDFDVGFFVRGNGVGPGTLDLDVATLKATRAQFADFGRELSPVVRAAIQRGVAVDHEVLGRGTLGRTRVFRHFMAPHGGRCTLLAPLSLRGRVLGMLALGRRGSGFRRSEQRRLQAWLPALRLCDAAHASEALVAGLSAREQDVLQYLCLGYTNAEIGRACGTSPNTVRNQLQAIYRKLGATTRAEAVALTLGGVP
jgi:DNA-binding CsgD family transcriptional regulator